MTRAHWLLIALVGVVTPYALARYGRSRMRAELAAFGADEASALADSMSFPEAVEAGARALVSGRSFASSGTATIVN